MSDGWRVLHRQVSDLTPLAIEPDYAGLYVCFWHGAVALGHAELLASELPLSSTQARELAAEAIAPALRAYLSARSPEAMVPEMPLHELSESRAPADGSLTHETSLVVCTRNRPIALDRCLRAIGALISGPAETIVVGTTAGDSSTEQVVSQHAGVRYVLAPQSGFGRARNVGVRHCSHPLIAFTDDDIVVTPDWLCELTAPFGDPEVAATSGLVFPAELRTHAQLIFERNVRRSRHSYEPRLYRRDFLHSSGRRAAPVWNICAGGNMAIRRSALELFGLFDERLGRGAAGSGEDCELWHRILFGGGTCAYVPAAVVHHFNPVEANMLGSEFYSLMRGHVATLLAQFAASREWRSLYRVGVELPLEAVETLVRWLLCRDRSERVMMHGFLGCAAGVGYWLLHPRGAATSRKSQAGPVEQVPNPPDADAQL